MMFNSNDTKCSFSGEIVSYMYGEIGAGERSVFESHLLNCTACTDEFAEIANARFSVYEWHAEEFVPLPTPEISIPYRLTTSRAGFFAGVRELFALTRWPVTAAAMLAVAVAAGFAAMFLSGGGEQQIAANLKDRRVADETQQVMEPDIKPVTEPKVETTGNEPVVRREVRLSMPSRANKRALTKRDTKAETQVPAANSNQRRESTTAIRASDAPVLSSFEDNDDRSLRLADLVDDGGTRR